MSGRYATEQAFFNERQRDPLGIEAARRIANGHNKLAMESLKSDHDACCDHTERAIIDVRMEKKFNPKELPNHVMSVLISEYRCPNCLGKLDAGLECKECEFWAQPWLDNSRAINDAAFDRREG